MQLLLQKPIYGPKKTHERDNIGYFDEGRDLEMMERMEAVGGIESGAWIRGTVRCNKVDSPK